MEMSEQINELAAALAKAQAAMKPAAKDSENPHFRSKYADLASIWEACRKPLTDNGLSIVQAPADAGDGVVSLRTLLLHSSGQWMATTVSARLTKNDAQGVGSALTYLRRYSLAGMVGVVADEDDDGNAASAGPQRASQPAQRQNGSAAYNRGEGGAQTSKRGDAVRQARAAAIRTGAGDIAPLPPNLDGLDDKMIADWLAYYEAFKEAA